MSGKDGSIEKDLAILSGLSAPDLNDMMGTGVRY